MSNENLANKIKIRVNTIFGSFELFIGLMFVLSAYLYTNTAYLIDFLPSEPFRTFIPFIFIVFGFYPYFVRNLFSRFGILKRNRIATIILNEDITIEALATITFVKGLTE